MRPVGPSIAYVCLWGGLVKETRSPCSIRKRGKIVSQERKTAHDRTHAFVIPLVDHLSRRRRGKDPAVYTRMVGVCSPQTILYVCRDPIHVAAYLGSG